MGGLDKHTAQSQSFLAHFEFICRDLPYNDAALISIAHSSPVTLSIVFVTASLAGRAEMYLL